jgi:hypothetical protein
VTLHVEDELLAVDRRARGVQVERGFVRDIEETTARTAAGVGGVHRQQRRRRAAGRHQETAAIDAQVLRVFSGRLERQPVGRPMHRRQRDRLRIRRWWRCRV